METPPDSEVKQRPLGLTIVAVSVLFAAAILCYWPSLKGPFLFDDVPNLSELGQRGGITDLDSFMAFVTGGESGPTGRPLSLASFALNAQNWPADPLPFRITNLLIHLVNALLVFFLSRSLLATRYDGDTAQKLGLVCMALWLLHPLTASTTAYVIQRMTQLSSLFVIVGLLCYVHGRKTIADTPQKGWAWIVGGLGVSGVLAVLSKESGALLPAYALGIELTVFAGATAPTAQRRALVLMLCAPLLVIAAYFALRWDAVLAGFDYRSFTMTERLLTQPVVLLEYLRQVFLPHLSGLGIVHDDFPVSRSLLDPVRTLLSIVVLAVLFGLAIFWRKRWPLVALGIFWFFAGHSLEAGPLSLELYFDHRNYLPLLGPIIAIVSMVPALPDQLRRAAPVLLLAFLCFSAFLTWQSARLWGNETAMMFVALHDHPGSLRARQYVANRYIAAEEYDKALATQLDIADDFPTHASTRLSILNLRCLTGSLTPADVNATRAFLESSSHDQQITGFLMPLLVNAGSGQCGAFGLGDYQALLDALLENPLVRRESRMRGAIHYFSGRAHYETGDLEAAIAALDRSFGANAEIDIRLQQVVWLLEAGVADGARRYLEQTREDLARRRWERDVLAADIEVLEQRVAALEQSVR